MTTEQQIRTGEAIIAAAKGEKVQFRSTLGRDEAWSDWNPMSEFTLWKFSDYEFRAKPEPLNRPWSYPEDVPGPVCWLRSNNGGPQMLIRCVYNNGATFTDRETDYHAYFSGNEFAKYEYSTDRKTWHKCEVAL